MMIKIKFIKVMDESKSKLPILLISCHGIYRNVDAEIGSVVSVKKVNATKMGVTNRLSEKTIVDLPENIEAILKENYTESELLNELVKKMKVVEYCDSNQESLNEYEHELSQTIDANAFLNIWKNREMYEIKEWRENEVYLDKTYEKYKNDSNLNEYDNKIILYYYDDGEVKTENMLPKFKKSSVVRIKLSQLLNDIKSKGFDDVIIIDLSCNSIDKKCSERKMRYLTRTKFNHGGKKKFTKRKINSNKKIKKYKRKSL